MRAALAGLMLAAAVTNPGQITYTANGGAKRSLALKLGDVVSVKDFGAVCDGATNDATAINAALATGREVHIPNGGSACVASATINLTVYGTILYIEGGASIYSTANPAVSATGANVAIVGAGQNSTITVASATNDGVVVSGSGNSFTMQGITISAGTGSSRTAGVALKFTSVSNPVVRDVYLQNPWDGLYVSQTGSGSFEDISITSTFATQAIHDGVYLLNGSNAISLRHVVVSTTQTAAFEAGFVFGKETDTIICEFCEVYAPSGGASYGMWWKNEGGTHEPRWIKVVNASVEVNHTTGVGFQFDYALSADLIGVYSAWGLNNILVGSGAKQIRVTGGEFILAYQYGILVNDGTDISVVNAVVSDSGQQTNNTYTGIALGGSATHGVRLVGNRVGNAIYNGSSPASATNFMQSGIFASGGSNNYSIIGNDLRTNTSSGLNDGGGPNKVVMGNYTTTSVGPQLGAVTQANLGTPANGSIAFCSDCTITNPCAGGGTGALAKRLNGGWVCN